MTRAFGQSMKDSLLTDFSSFGLAEPLVRALKAEGYATPTPIQAQSIPLLLEGHDLLGIAQTGTGKTAAFALPILNKLIAENRRAQPGTCRALILAPTRELAAQIGESFKAYGKFTRLSVAVVFGGVGYGPQYKALRAGVDVLVATPGRLIDHLDEKVLRLDGTGIVVLDEADHMLDLGFVVPIRKILSKLPAKRQSLFFSATMPKEIAGLAGEMLRNPKEVKVAPVATTAERVDQQVVFCDAGAKRGLLVELFADPQVFRAIVFTRTKRGADRVSQTLDGCGVESAAIHGNKSQNQRTRALDDFKAGRTRVLVATDIAARGIDIEAVDLVVNFELPEVPEQYVHRIGRTARAGASGKAIAFCDSSERGLLKDIERVTRQRIPSVDKRGQKGAEVPTAIQTRPQPHRDPRGARPSGRPQGNAKPRGDFAPRQDRADAPRDVRPPRQDNGPVRFGGEPRQGQNAGRPGAPGKRKFRPKFRQRAGG
jgi:ATP-dependent RNA helicase RhlE